MWQINLVTMSYKHSLLSCRNLQLDIPADSEASPRRNIPGSVSSPLMNGEKSIFRDHNAGFTALASPLRREIGNRHVCVPCSLFLKISLCTLPCIVNMKKKKHNNSANTVLSI